MLTGLLALVIASAFAGAAIYVNIAEHPARMSLDDRAMLAEWKPSYKRGAVMQASLALIACALGLIACALGLIACALGLIAWWQSGTIAFLIGALLILAPWPWTLLAIMPTNKTLLATRPQDASTQTRVLLEKWNRLHAGRTLLGVLSVAAFFTALT